MLWGRLKGVLKEAVFKGYTTVVKSIDTNGTVSTRIDSEDVLIGERIGFHTYCCSSTG